MNKIVDKIVNDEISLNDIDSLRSDISQDQVQEIENISFLKEFVNKNNFSEPLLPDTVKPNLLNKIFKSFVLIPNTTIAIFLAFFLVKGFFNNDLGNSNKAIEVNKVSKINLTLFTEKESNPIITTSDLQINNLENYNKPILDKNKKTEKVLKSSIEKDKPNYLISKSKIKRNKALLSNNKYLTDLENTRLNPSNYYAENNLEKASKKISVSLTKINPLKDYNTDNYNIQSFNDINFKIDYKYNNFNFGLSLRRENFALNYDLIEDNISYNVTEYPNLTSGLLSVAYSFDFGEVSPFVNLEYGLNRRGHIYGINAGIDYNIFENISFNISISNYNLKTFENISSNKFALQYGIEVNL